MEKKNNRDQIHFGMNLNICGSIADLLMKILSVYERVWKHTGIDATHHSF